MSGRLRATLALQAVGMLAPIAWAVRLFTEPGCVAECHAFGLAAMWISLLLYGLPLALVSAAVWIGPTVSTSWLMVILTTDGFVILGTAVLDLGPSAMIITLVLAALVVVPAVVAAVVSVLEWRNNRLEAIPRSGS